jgi:hypothetical protein
VHRINDGRVSDQRCNTAKRLEILLLLGTLATLVAWLVGLAGRTMQLNWQLQANTTRKRQVLSTSSSEGSSLRAQRLRSHLLFLNSFSPHSKGILLSPLSSNFVGIP